MEQSFPLRTASQTTQPIAGLTWNVGFPNRTPPHPRSTTRLDRLRETFEGRIPGERLPAVSDPFVVAGRWWRPVTVPASASRDPYAGDESNRRPLITVAIDRVETRDVLWLTDR